tara:strand:- start:339 stop:983 length:645 start_codon:yes stop_codon:yes gene_type:complete
LLAIFDTEGVLVDGEFMPHVARLSDKEKEVSEITNQGITGEIDWVTGLHKRIELLKGISYDDCCSIANEMTIMDGAFETISELKKLGFTTITVSGGPDVLINRLKNELNLDYAFCNDLVFENNKLTNINVNVNNKAKVVMNWFDGKFPNSLPPPDLSLDTAISIVDGANDVPLFDICKLNIAFNAQEIVKNNANVIINKKNLLEILPHVKKILS